MKTYTQLINELSNKATVGFAALGIASGALWWKNNKKTLNKYRKDFSKQSNFKRVIKDIETNYPGVNEFMYMASKWAHEVSPNLDKDLYSILKRLKHRNDIEELSEKELQMLYKFLVRRKLDSYDDMETLFIEAIPEEQE